MSISVMVEAPRSARGESLRPLANLVADALRVYQPHGVRVGARVSVIAENTGIEAEIRFTVFVDGDDRRLACGRTIRLACERTMLAWMLKKHGADFVAHEVRQALSELGRACFLSRAEPPETGGEG